jgi:hypothetical protein
MQRRVVRLLVVDWVRGVEVVQVVLWVRAGVRCYLAISLRVQRWMCCRVRRVMVGLMAGSGALAPAVVWLSSRSV